MIELVSDIIIIKVTALKNKKEKKIVHFVEYMKIVLLLIHKLLRLKSRENIVMY